MNRKRFVVACALALVTLLSVSTSALASSTYSWTLSCSGNDTASGAGSASWQWLANGAPISGASGSAGCSGTMSGSGSGTIPTGANGIEVTVSVLGNSKTVTQTFSPGATFDVKDGVSAHASYTVCAPFTGICTTYHLHETVDFTLQS